MRALDTAFYAGWGIVGYELGGFLLAGILLIIWPALVAGAITFLSDEDEA